MHHDPNVAHCPSYKRVIFFVPKKRFSGLSGYSENSLRIEIIRRVWPQNQFCVNALYAKVLVDAKESERTVADQDFNQETDRKGPTSTTPVDSSDMSKKDVINLAALFGLKQGEDESDKEFKAKVMKLNDRRIARLEKG